MLKNRHFYFFLQFLALDKISAYNINVKKRGGKYMIIKIIIALTLLFSNSWMDLKVYYHKVKISETICPGPLCKT